MNIAKVTPSYIFKKYVNKEVKTPSVIAYIILSFLQAGENRFNGAIKTNENIIKLFIIKTFLNIIFNNIDINK